MQTPATSQSGRLCQVELDVADALSVGLSIRSLVRTRRLPTGTVEIYERVAQQLISSARVAIKQANP